MNLPSLAPAIDGARADAGMGGGFFRRHHADLGPTGSAPSRHAALPVPDLERPLGGERNFDPFHLTSQISAWLRAPPRVTFSNRPTLASRAFVSSRQSIN